MRKYILQLLLLSSISGFSQEKLTLESVIKTALANNLGIQVLEIQQQAFEKDVHAGKAGLLPKLDAVAGGNYSNSTADIEFAGGIPPLVGANATTIGYNAGLQLSYNLFDGLGSFRLYEKLKTQEDINAVQTKINIESLILQTIASFHDVLRNQQQLEIFKGTAAISRERLEKANSNFEFGAVGKIEVLNAQVDYNNDWANVLTQQENLNSSKRQLNYLLGKNPEESIVVEENLVINNPNDIVLDSLKQKVNGNNSSLIVSELSLDVAELDKKMAYSQYAPKVAINGTYGLNYTENNASVLLKSSSLGFTGGISLSWNLFNGNNNRKALEKSKLLIEASETKKQEAQINLEKELLNLYSSMLLNFQLIELEQENIKAAELNLERSKELYYNGTITNLQFRQAQVNVLMAQSKLNNLQFQSKIQEYQLKRLADELIL